jgi:hypothetical protein
VQYTLKWYSGIVGQLYARGKAWLVFAGEPSADTGMANANISRELTG